MPIGELVERRADRSRGLRRHGVTRVVAVKANGASRSSASRFATASSSRPPPTTSSKRCRERRTDAAWLRVDQLRPGMRLHLHPHRAKVAASRACRSGRRRAGVRGRAGADEDTSPSPRPRSPVGCRRTGSSASTRGHQPVTDDRVPGRKRRRVRVGRCDNLDIVFPDVHRNVATSRRRMPPRLPPIRLYGEVLREFVERWELLARGTACACRAALDSVARRDHAYLRSLFQADGYVTVAATRQRTDGWLSRSSASAGRRTYSCFSTSSASTPTAPKERVANRPSRPPRSADQHRLGACALRRAGRLPGHRQAAKTDRVARAQRPQELSGSA